MECGNHVRQTALDRIAVGSAMHITRRFAWGKCDEKPGIEDKTRSGGRLHPLQRARIDEASERLQVSEKSPDGKLGSEKIPGSHGASSSGGEPYSADNASFVLASSTAARMRGLLLSRPNKEELLLVPCRDVHTVGMRRRIDIAFIDNAGCVIEVHRDVGPLRRLRNRRAAAVVERFSSCSTPWYSVGDRLGIMCFGEVEA